MPTVTVCGCIMLHSGKLHNFISTPAEDQPWYETLGNVSKLANLINKSDWLRFGVLI